MNVRLGACSIIQHGSARVSVIDVNSAFTPEPTKVARFSMAENYQKSWSPVPGNFQQKDDPDNPIAYLRKLGVSSIFRFILTHPDMDHMGGITDLFMEFSPGNLWDTANTKEFAEGAFNGRPKLGADWEFYKRLRDTSPDTNPRRLVFHSGASNDFYKQDGLQILAPTKELVQNGNRIRDWNDASYVILYRCAEKRILFSGDSEDRTWEHILKTWTNAISDVDVLIAPHHGRDSGRDYEFLNVVNPKLTLFGNASSDHLAYQPWYKRDLPILTNNQAGYIILDIDSNGLNVYVKNETYAKAFAERNQFRTFRSEVLDAWYLRSV
ncbi:MAG: hypothetical protein K2X38_22900 [Gemmataceae bacterium]|nr:hypothetical protein [Gemmataceae bacterium]